MIGKRLKEIREKTGMNKKEFADYIGVKYTTYNNYETGAREPASDFLILISTKFDVSIDYILGLQAEKEILHSYKLKATEYARIEKYRDLDDHGKDMVDTVLTKEYARCKTTPETERVKEFPSAVRDSQADYLAADAANSRPDVTEEDTQKSNDLMRNDNEWNDAT